MGTSEQRVLKYYGWNNRIVYTCTCLFFNYNKIVNVIMFCDNVNLLWVEQQNYLYIYMIILILRSNCENLQHDGNNVMIISDDSVYYVTRVREVQIRQLMP